MKTLTRTEAATIEGGYVDWGDYWYGALWAMDLSCIYTKNPYVCGAALVGHGINVFVTLD